MLRCFAMLAVSLAATPPFPMSIAVNPNPMPYDHRGAVLAVHAPSGAVCTGHVRYDQTRRKPTSFRAITISVHGAGRWTWHEQTKAHGGTATVSCTYRGASRVVATHFVVLHR